MPTLVVGTTPDYIEIIRKRWPGRVLFLTDPSRRRGATENDPGPLEEVLWPLEDDEGAWGALKEHISRNRQTVRGVACYDCESLPAAALLAARLSLPWHAAENVLASRSKPFAKEMWVRAGVPCARFAVMGDGVDPRAAAAGLRPPLILKPVCGSGSELVFRCETLEQAIRCRALTLAMLQAHTDTLLYPDGKGLGADADPRRTVLVEEVVDGPEFSADFFLCPDGVQVLRVAAKVLDPTLGAGTVLAYAVPALARTGLAEPSLADSLGRAARALGFTRGLFMADFIIQGGEAVFLELSPRVSGDCLPSLLMASGGLDLIGLALDVAEGAVPAPVSGQFQPMAAVRFFARRQGIVTSLGTGRLTMDPRVVETILTRHPGHRVNLPPADYFSRILGHAIFRPTPGGDIVAECIEVAGELDLAVGSAE